MRGVHVVVALALVSGLLGCHRFRGRHHRSGLQHVAPASLASGEATTCSVENGDVTCWGRALDRDHATHVDALNGARQVVVTMSERLPVWLVGPQDRTEHLCAVMAGGRVRCMQDGRAEPIEGLRQPVEELVASYGGSVCGRTRGGVVSCTRVELTAEPRRLEALRGATRIAGGTATAFRAEASVYHRILCGIVRDGRALCVGAGEPMPFPGRDYVDLATGGGRACAVSRSGDVDCLDEADGSRVALAFPPATRVAVGEHHACVVTRTHEVACTGRGEHGQLGTGALDDADAAHVVAGLSGVTDVTVGALHACVRHTGGVSCFGAGHEGATGPGAFRSVSRFSVPGARALDVGDGSGCVRTEAGTLACFGDNAAGQLADGTSRFRATPVVAQLPGVAHVDGPVGLDYGGACAIVDGGRVACWAGLGRYDDAPDDLASVTDAVALYGGGLHVWVARANGTVQAYVPSTGHALEEVHHGVATLHVGGAADALVRGPCALVAGAVTCLGSARDGDATRRLPEPVVLTQELLMAPGVSHSDAVTCNDAPCGGRLRDVAQLVSYDGTCARLVSGRVACWGDFEGAKPFGRVRATEVPLYVNGIEDAADVCLGEELCVRHADGHVDCRGGETGVRAVPELDGTSALACGYGLVCGLRGDVVVCLSEDGQLGSVSATPRDVVLD